MQSFGADELSLPTYRRYLLLQWRLHAPLEVALARWLPADWVTLRLRKSDWLRRDLQTLGWQPVESPAQRCEIESVAQALGVLYVLEGSTLGLQVVRRQLQQRHPAVLCASRFILGYGADTGRHWRDFLARLETLDRAGWPLAESAACATFAHFLDAFSRVE